MLYALFYFDGEEWILIAKFRYRYHLDHFIKLFPDSEQDRFMIKKY